MPDFEPITAIVLAGGNSARMGQDKARLIISGLPLLQQTCQIAQQCCHKVLVITPQQTTYHDIIPEDCQVISEERDAGTLMGPGPLVAVLYARPYVLTQWFLLLACDLPRLTVDVLQIWQAQLRTVPETAIALLARNDKGWEPLCGFYRTRCLSSLEQYVDAGGRSFQTWLKHEKAAELTVTNQEALLNCNTPADWQTIMAQQNRPLSRDRLA